MYECDVQDIPRHGLDVSEYSMEENAVEDCSNQLKQSRVWGNHSIIQLGAFDLFFPG